MSRHRPVALPAPLLHLPQVTLIDQSDRFVFKPLLYELLSGAASEEEVAPPFAQLLAPYPVTFVQGRVASVQPEHATQVCRPFEAELAAGCVSCGCLGCVLEARLRAVQLQHSTVHIRCRHRANRAAACRLPLPRTAAPPAAAPWCWQTGGRCRTTGWWCRWVPRPPRLECPA